MFSSIRVTDVSSYTFPNSAMRSIPFQPWLTVRNTYAAASASPITSITQDPEGWLDLANYQDAACWVEVRDVAIPAAADSVTLTLETSPTPENALFTACTPAVTLVASSNPFIVRTVRTPTVTPLARYLRWRLKTNTTTNGVWGATFRLRLAPAKTPFFMPTQLSGLALWLRSDLGITLNGTNVSGWNDQSGQGNHAIQGTAGSQPPYAPNGGANNLPRLSATPAAAKFMTGAFASSVTDHTAFAAASFSAPVGNYAAIAGTNSTLTVNTSFSMFTDSASVSIFGRLSSSIGNNSDAATTDLSSLGKMGIYSTLGSASTIDIFVNGISKTSNTATQTEGPATNYVLLSLNGTAAYPFAGDFYETLVYSRALSSDERRLVHRYLGNRYGVSVP